MPTCNQEAEPGDGIAWIQYLKSLDSRPSTTIYATATYANKGKNKNYLGGTQIYEFGNETQISLGVSDKLNLGKSIFDASLEIRYRKAWEDEVNDEILPNTGGQWIFLNPSIAYWFGEKASLSLGADFPVLANVTGTQLTPTYRLNVGLFCRIK